MIKTLPSENRPRCRILLLLLAALILTFLCCSMTFLEFSSQLYTKRSPNTFVGDEKYTAARAEA